MAIMSMLMSTMTTASMPRAAAVSTCTHAGLHRPRHLPPKSLSDPRMQLAALNHQSACASFASAPSSHIKPLSVLQHRHRVVAQHSAKRWGLPKSSDEQVTMTGGCYEEVVDALAHRVLGAASRLPPGRKLLIGIAGAPGSGKSTLATLVVRRINELAAASGSNACPQGAASSLTQEGQAVQPAVQVPMDGFHYYRKELDAMPDPQLAHFRRGAPFTFDAPAFVDCVRGIREAGEARVPSFDHGVGDPKPADIHVKKEHRIVVIEGNYVLLPFEPWHGLKRVLDETWFVDVDLDVAMERVFRRQTGHGRPADVVRGRIAGNDRPNGELVAASKRFADVVVPSSIPFRQPPLGQ